MCSSFARTSRTSTLYVPPESSNSLANDANVAPPSLIGASERVPPRRVPDDVFLEETSEGVHVAGGEGGVDRLEGGEIRMLSQRTSCSTRALYAAASARSPRPTSRRRARHDASLGTLFTVCGVVLVERAMICWPQHLHPATRHGFSSASGYRRLPSCVADRCESVADLVEDGGIVDRRRGGVFLAVGDAAHGSPQDFSRSGLGQALDDEGGLEGRDRADALADELHSFCDDLGVRALDAGFQD